MSSKDVCSRAMDLPGALKTAIPFGVRANVSSGYYVQRHSTATSHQAGGRVLTLPEAAAESYMIKT